MEYSNLWSRISQTLLSSARPKTCVWAAGWRTSRFHSRSQLSLEQYRGRYKILVQPVSKPKNKMVNVKVKLIQVDYKSSEFETFYTA